MNQFNALFQSRQPLIFILKNESESLFFKTGQNFLKPEILDTRHLKSNIFHPTNYLPLNEIFVRPEYSLLLNTLRPKTKHQILFNILAFYLSLAEEILSRLPIANIFKEIEYFNPLVILDADKHKNYLQNISNLYKDLIDITALSYEW